ncbi:MAG: ABC transporter permease [Clostridia bacterium]|nr:ABC transporter permease [Clostridia bacterium]
MNNIIIDGMTFALPLFIMAIGGIFSEKSGVTNLALEGLQGMGAFIGALAATIAVSAGVSDDKSRMLAFLFAALGGGLYACLHAVLCIRFKANQVISGVVINILAMSLTSFLTKAINRTVFGAASDKFILAVSKRITVPGISRIPVIGAFFTRVYPFEILIIVLAFIAWFVLYKTTFGLRLRACGANPSAVDAAGGDVAKLRFVGVVVSGALSGIAGMCFAYSILAKFSGDIYMGYGYLSIAGYIFGNWSLLPTLAACLIFGFARSGGYQLVQALGMPSAYSDLVMILPYELTLFLLIFLSKKNQAPKALGEIYDKAKR